MHFSAALLGAIIQLLPLAIGSPTGLKRTLDNNGYVSFYSSSDCSSPPGTAVSMGNTGCVSNEYDRASIFVQPGTESEYGNCMHWYSDNECLNMIASTTVIYNDGANYCDNLIDGDAAQSYSFQTGPCE